MRFCCIEVLFHIFYYYWGKGYLTIILQNRAEYRLTIFREIERDNCFIIQQIDNKTAEILVNLSVDIFSLHFFFPRTKLRIPPDICYLWMTDIKSIMTIFG